MTIKTLEPAAIPAVEYVLPTGIQVLDEYLSGGLRAGSIVALLADPASQSELLLAELTHERQTLYLTFQRSPAAVIDSLRRAGADLDHTRVYAVGPEKPLDEAFLLVQDLGEEATIVIDPANALESVADERFAAFLNAVKTHISGTRSMLVLHCLTGESPPARRSSTEYMADVVFELDTQIHGDRVDNRLFVLKNRGGSALAEALKLELTDRVLIDTSREIA